MAICCCTASIANAFAGKSQVFEASGWRGGWAAAVFAVGLITSAAVQAQTISTVAGSGSVGDGGPATSAPVYPHGVAVDVVGNVYIADADSIGDSSSRIRKVAPNGTITTVAGAGGH
jgi:hypothetical protein